MRERLRAWAGRLALALAFAPVLAVGAWHVGLAHLLPLVPFTPPLPGLGPAGPWGTALLLVLVPAAFLSAPHEGRGGIGLLSLASGVLATAAYPWSRLDWSLLLLDLGLTHGSAPTFGVLAWALLPLGAAWAVHVGLLAREARAHYGAKGPPDHQAEEAAAAVRRWGLLPPAAGGAGAALALAGFVAAPPLPSPGPTLAPLALGAVAVAGTVLALRAARATGG